MHVMVKATHNPPFVPFCTGVRGHLHRAAEDHQNRAGVRGQGFHLHLHPGNAAEVGGVRLRQVFHQRLVLAGLPHCGRMYIARTQPNNAFKDDCNV